MIRTGLWLAAGVVLGLIIHIAVILSLPLLTPHDVWTRVSALGARNQMTLLQAVSAGEPNPFRLDPELAYAVCRLDLREGPGVVSGVLPQAFWSVAVYDRAGTIIYSTTNRDGIGQSLDLGLFNPGQTRLLAEQRLNVAPGLLIVEAQSDELFVLVRLAPPHPAMRARYEVALGRLACGNIKP